MSKTAERPVYHPVGPKPALVPRGGRAGRASLLPHPRKALGAQRCGGTILCDGEGGHQHLRRVFAGSAHQAIKYWNIYAGGKIHHRGHAERDPQFFPGALHLLGAHPRGARDGGPQPLGRPGVLQASRHSRPHKLLRDPARSHRHLPPEGKPQGRPGPPAGRAANIPPCRSPSWTGIPSACRATPLASGR